MPAFLALLGNVLVFYVVHVWALVIRQIDDAPIRADLVPLEVRRGEATIPKPFDHSRIVVVHRWRFDWPWLLHFGQRLKFFVVSKAQVFLGPSDGVLEFDALGFHVQPEQVTLVTGCEVTPHPGLGSVNADFHALPFSAANASAGVFLAMRLATGQKLTADVFHILLRQPFG